MNEEFNLSEKISNESINEGQDLNIIYAEDVKEFIRRLKEDINDPETISHFGKTQQERLAIILYVKDFINKKIDKLAGDKLKGGER